MLFHSSIRRELARSFGATLLVLFTIVLTMLLIGVLGQANKGRIDPEEFVLILTFTLIGRAPTILTIALFIAVVSTLTRMYRESEMVIWMNAGKGLTHFLSPIAKFSWPIILLIGILVLWAWPWSNQQIDSLRDRFERRGDLQRVSPGQFTELSGGRRVFFVDKSDDAEQGGQNIFILNLDPNGQESITTSRFGQILWDNDRQLLSLSNGHRIENPPNSENQNLRVIEFASYEMLIDERTNYEGYSGGLKSIPTLKLLDTRNRFFAAELSWRLGTIFTAINFVLLAVAVSTGNSRAGKSGHMLFLLSAFIVYFNILNIGQSWVVNEKIHWVSMMVLVHGLIFLSSSLLLAKRHFALHFMSFLKVRISQ